MVRFLLCFRLRGRTNFFEAGEVASRRRDCAYGIISQITIARQIPQVMDQRA